MSLEINPIYQSGVLTHAGEYVPETLDRASLSTIEQRTLQEHEIKNWWNSIKENLTVDHPEVEKAYSNLETSVSRYMGNEDIKDVKDAYLYTYFCHNFRAIDHRNRYRKDKVTHYTVHPIEVAKIWADKNLRKETVISSLLHDVREDTYATSEEIYSLFGMRVGQNVEDVTKIRRESKSETDALQLYKLYSSVKDIAEGGNLEAVLIKIADRIHNMQTLGNLDIKRRKEVAWQTYRIYAPLADRLGLPDLAEDLRYLSLKHLTKVADKAKKEKEKWNARFKSHPFFMSLHNVVEPLSINSFVDLTSKPAQVATPTSGVLRISYGSTEEREIILNRFKDSFISEENRVHKISDEEYVIDNFFLGDSKWKIKALSEHQEYLNSLSITERYKYGDPDVEKKRDLLNEKIKGTHEIIRRYEEGDIDSFMAAVTERLPFTQIPVITPKGERIWMNEGSTAADFAFEIHEDLLPRAIGVTVNGQVNQALSTILKPGDICHIETAQTWEDIDPFLLVNAGLTNPSAIHHFKQALSTILEGSSSEQAFNKALNLSKLEVHDLNLLNKRVGSKVKHIALLKLEEIYEERFGKKPEYDFSETWDYALRSFKGKFKTWDKFLHSVVLKEVEPRFINEFFKGLKEYEKKQYDTGPIDVINQDGVIAFFSQALMDAQVGIISFTRVVNNPETQHGEAKIRLLLDPKGKDREEIKRLISQLHQEYDLLLRK